MRSYRKYVLPGIIVTAMFLSVSLYIYFGNPVHKPAISGTETNTMKAEDLAGKDAARSVRIEIKRSIRITAVGDVLLGRGVGARIKRQNKSYTSAFEEVVRYLRSGDVIFGNLEEPITDREISLADHTNGGKFILKNPVEAFAALQYAGFNLFSLANNHILDFYGEGLGDTLNLLDKNGIAHAGAGENLALAREAGIIERNGFKVGLLAYTDMADILFKGDPNISFAAEAKKTGVAPRTMGYIREDILKSRPVVDILIVSLHWGVEGSSQTTPDQIECAHQIMDLGADIILGHHPHRFQGIEFYKGKPIVYSLGNFIFDQNDPQSQQSFIIDMKLGKNGLEKMTAIPVKTVDKIRVARVTGAEALRQIVRLSSLSAKLKSRGRIQEDSLVFDLTRPPSTCNVSLAGEN